MNELAIIGATCLSSEMVLWLPLPKTARTLVDTLHRSKKILLSKHISDDWKEKILPVYAFRIFKQSVFLPILIALIMAPILLISWALSPSFIRTIVDLTKPFTLSIMVATSVVYLMIRMKFSR
ncbi:MULTISPECIES: hypothetical protein [Methylomicrobium]|uniref:Uncharacterized protein n=1 Tax=Methylomicrobium album BG8 TaxID=686340 RepID=H8GL78_METAL|nr:MULTISPECIES: hypothetical protein [Methylomicrobium]EIC28077.1 hypothetical protein Metal_0211 [Methylomicrobium album BG8]